MLPGIRIRPRNRRSKLDRMSKVDFRRMYTIEHNVKVVEIGDVHPSHLGRLQSQWIGVITDEGFGGRVSSLNARRVVQEAGDDEDEDYEDEDEDDEVERTTKTRG
jgi:hypothetical protein